MEAASPLCNMSIVGVCGQGSCELFKSEPHCSCHSKYNPETNCTELLSLVTNTATIPTDAIVLTIYLCLGLLGALELAMDWKKNTNSFSWKNPILLMKILFVLYCVADSGRMCQEIYQDATHTLAVTSFSRTYQNVVSGFLSATFILAVITWTSLLSAVRNFDRSVGGLSKLRIAGWILLLVVYPTHTVLQLLRELGVGGVPLKGISYIVAALFLFPVVFGSMILLLRVIIWHRAHASEILDKAFQKSLWLGFSSVGYMLILMFVIVNGLFPLGFLNPFVQYYWSLPQGSVSSPIVAIGMFMFLQNYVIFNGQFLKAYWVFIRKGTVPVRVVANTSTATTRSSTTGTIPQSKISVTSDTVVPPSVEATGTTMVWSESNESVDVFDDDESF